MRRPGTVSMSWKARRISRLIEGASQEVTHLANNPERTENEGDVHAEHDLNQTLGQSHHSVRVGVLLHRLEDEVEVQSLLGGASKTRVEQGSVESAVETIGDGLCRKTKSARRETEMRD